MNFSFLATKSDSVDHGRVGHALGSDASGLLFGGCEALFTEPLNSLFDISVGSGEGLFAVHHADAGLFAEVFNVLCAECHICYILSK